MKRLILIGATLLAIVALSATQFTNILNLKVTGKTLLGTTTETGNAITKSLGSSATIDFTGIALGCADSSGITVTGASTGDPCFVGAPSTIGTADAGVNSSFTCYVSAADTVKVRFCTQAFQDPASGTYYVRVVSAQ